MTSSTEQDRLESGRGPTDDQALVVRLRAGEEQAYREMVERFGPRMLSVARRFTQHEQDAQDVVQDAFMLAFRAIEAFKEESQLWTWLHRITVNSALTKLRKRTRQMERSIDDLMPRFDDQGGHTSPLGDWAADYDKSLENREIREAVGKAIAQLPEMYRTVLVLRDIEGVSIEETAQALQLSQGAVKTRLHRARQALRTMLEPVFVEELRA